MIIYLLGCSVNCKIQSFKKALEITALHNTFSRHAKYIEEAQASNFQST